MNALKRLSLAKLCDAVDKAGTISAVAERAGVDKSILSRILRGKRRPFFDIVVAIASAAGVELNELLADSAPTSWHKLNTSVPGAYDAFLNEMRDARHLLAIGRTLHCFLVPGKMLAALREQELRELSVDEAIIEQRMSEQKAMYAGIEEWARKGTFERYRVIGVPHVLMQTVSCSLASFDELLDNIKVNTYRAAMAFQSPEEFHHLRMQLRRTLGLRFNDVTVMDNDRICLWNEDGVFFSDDHDLAEKANRFLIEYMRGKSPAFPLKSDRPTTAKMRKAADDTREELKKQLGRISD